MKIIRVLVNKRLLDATTEEDIAKHKAIDDAEALLDAAKFAMNGHEFKWP
jgi:hypothetical protein